MTTNEGGAETARQTYYPFGAVRTTSGTLPTDHTFTGQKLDASAGLMYYGARYYAAEIGRFAQPDSIIPNPYNPQDLNRYSYARNNSLRYRDPSGHWLESALDIFFIGLDIADIQQNGLTWESGLSLAADVGGLILPGVTGGGLAVRAIAHLDDAADAVKAADRLADAARVASHADDLADAAKVADRAEDALVGAKPIVSGVADGANELERSLVKKGGRYGDIAASGGEVHHMPAKSASPLDPDKGPAIWMEKRDHRQTSSWGRSKTAQEYRMQQKTLIDEGRFDDAIQMDIDDIRSKFGEKYDDEILEMIDGLDDDIYRY